MDSLSAARSYRSYQRRIIRYDSGNNTRELFAHGTNAMVGAINDIEAETRYEIELNGYQAVKNEDLVPAYEIISPDLSRAKLALLKQEYGTYISTDINRNSLLPPINMDDAFENLFISTRHPLAIYKQPPFLETLWDYAQIFRMSEKSREFNKLISRLQHLAIEALLRNAKRQELFLRRINKAGIHLRSGAYQLNGKDVFIDESFYYIFEVHKAL